MSCRAAGHLSTWVRQDEFLTMGLSCIAIADVLGEEAKDLLCLFAYVARAARNSPHMVSVISMKEDNFFSAASVLLLSTIMVLKAAASSTGIRFLATVIRQEVRRMTL